MFAAAYLGASSGRLRTHSPYNHYVYLAEGWLHGRLALAGGPPNENDWAKVDVLVLRDGRTVRGSYGGRGGPAEGRGKYPRVMGMAPGDPFVSLDVAPARSKPPGPTFVATSDHLPRGEHGGSVS